MPSESTIAVCCGTCPYFVLAEGETGNCHLNPPAYIVVPGQVDLMGKQGPPMIRSVWPPVHKNEWCGKHPLFGLGERSAPIDQRLAGEAEGTG